jgi:hypothetical protein
MAPSEGIEPPAEEPESSVLSITPRGLDVVLGQYVKRMIHPHLDVQSTLKMATFLLYKGCSYISTMNDLKSRTLL